LSHYDTGANGAKKNVSCDADGKHEGVRTASVDAPPILEPTERVLDIVALAIECGVVRRIGTFRLTFGVVQPAFSKGGTKPVGVITPVADQGIWPWAKRRS